jgi:hypothetical protein
MLSKCVELILCKIQTHSSKWNYFKPPVIVGFVVIFYLGGKTGSTDNMQCSANRTADTETQQYNTVTEGQ